MYSKKCISIHTRCNQKKTTFMYRVSKPVLLLPEKDTCIDNQIYLICLSKCVCVENTNVHILYMHALMHVSIQQTIQKQIRLLNKSFTGIPSLGSAEEVGIFMHGKQSILLSSALEKSKTIKATKAVTCRKKSNRTANASPKKKKTTSIDKTYKFNGKHSSNIFLFEYA